MMTGLYPAGHGIHENARTLSTARPLAAERLKEAGYETAAFVSAFPLARRFGLARGFDVYDDELKPGRSERSAEETTDRALVWLDRDRSGQKMHTEAFACMVPKVTMPATRRPSSPGQLYLSST